MVKELQTNCEIVWAGLKLHGKKTLYLCSFYRPDDADHESLKKFGESLDRLSTNPNAHVLIGGDFNFPGFEWETETLKPKATAVGQHREFLELIRDHGLEQMVTEPTRLNNTLDLILTNTPGLVPRVETVMGVSDHEIVYCKYNIAVEKTKQRPRWINLYNKPDWDGMKEAMRILHSSLAEEEGNPTTEGLWTRFKEAYLQAEETYVPRKRACPKCSKPWVTPDIKKLINKRARVYRQIYEEDRMTGPERTFYGTEKNNTAQAAKGLLDLHKWNTDRDPAGRTCTILEKILDLHKAPENYKGRGITAEGPRQAGIRTQAASKNSEWTISICV